MLLETTKDELVKSLTGVFTGHQLRYESDYPQDKTEPYMVLSFLPTNRKWGMSIDGNYQGERDNPLYENYGYADVDRVAVRVLKKEVGNENARVITQNIITGIERFIKINWNTYISGGSIDQFSFSHSFLAVPNTKRIYGYEVTFDVFSPNEWHNEPDSGAETPIYLTGFRLLGGDISGLANVTRVDKE